jgi:hypothetical protein
VPDKRTGRETADRLRRELLARRRGLLAKRRELLAMELDFVAAASQWRRGAATRLPRDIEEMLEQDAREVEEAEQWWRELLEKHKREGTLDQFLYEMSDASDSEEGTNEADNVPVSIYLADEDIHGQVETAVEQWLTTADVFIDTRTEPVIGSWFRRMEASVKSAVRTPAAREALLTATHIADSHLVQSQDAYVTATLLQNVGPVLQALQPTKDAVVRAGALLIVKVDWVVQVHQLTAAQQAILDHQSQLAASPKEIITALQPSEPESQEAALPSVMRPIGRGGAAAATGD